MNRITKNLDSLVQCYKRNFEPGRACGKEKIMFYIKERRAYITEENRVVYDYGVNLLHDVFEGYTQGNTYEKIVESFNTKEEAYNALEKYNPGRYDFGNGIEAQIDWFVDCETDQKVSQYTWEPIVVL